MHQAFRDGFEKVALTLKNITRTIAGSAPVPADLVSRTKQLNNVMSSPSGRSKMFHKFDIASGEKPGFTKNLMDSELSFKSPLHKQVRDEIRAVQKERKG
jgi:hypothetical protein